MDKVFTGKVSEDKKLTFETDKFSTYVLTKDKKETPKEEEPTIKEEKETVITIKDDGNYLDAKLDLDKEKIAISEEEKGKNVDISLSVKETSSELEKAELKKVLEERKQEIVTYFDTAIEKTVKDKTIKLNCEAEITITVPSNAYDAKLEYSIYRAYKGEDGTIKVESVFKGKADSSKQITFKAVQSSTYALSYEKVEPINEEPINDDPIVVEPEKEINVTLIIIIAAIFVLAIIFTISRIKRKK